MIVNVLGAAGQPLTVVVTVIVAIAGTVVLLIVVNDAISPEPLAANPIVGLSFVQV